MSDIDPMFLNADGTINYDTALRAGRASHARNAATTMTGLADVMKRCYRQPRARLGRVAG